MGFAISIFLKGSLRIKVVCRIEGFLFFYRSTQPTCPLSSIYGLVLVGWVERSSKVCLYFSNRTLLFCRRVLKICQVKPNASRCQEHWLVGFRYIYLLEGFMKPNALRRQEHWLVGFRYIYLLEGLRIKVVCRIEGFLFFYRSTQPTCPLSSIYGLVLVGWVERSSKVCLYFSKRTLLFSREVLKICQVKPNALRRQEHWLVGFRYIYLLERFVADQSCV